MLFFLAMQPKGTVIGSKKIKTYRGEVYKCFSLSLRCEIKTYSFEPDTILLWIVQSRWGFPPRERQSGSKGLDFAAAQFIFIVYAKKKIRRIIRQRERRQLAAYSGSYQSLSIPVNKCVCPPFGAQSRRKSIPD